MSQNSYAFKNTDVQFFLKSQISCDSRHVIYVVKCPTCKKEYKGETGIGELKLIARVRIYQQNIWQPQHNKLRTEKHLRTCNKGNFPIFAFLQLRTNDTDHRQEYKDYFIKKFKTKLNNL